MTRPPIDDYFLYGGADSVSGDVTAAIERLRSRFPDLDHFGETVMLADVRTVLAEVERLRAERDRATSKAEDFEDRYETSHANYMHALKVIDRYEAEREALHSDETRERFESMIRNQRHGPRYDSEIVESIYRIIQESNGETDT